MRKSEPKDKEYGIDFISIDDCVATIRLSLKDATEFLEVEPELEITNQNGNVIGTFPTSYVSEHPHPSEPGETVYVYSCDLKQADLSAGLYHFKATAGYMIQESRSVKTERDKFLEGGCHMDTFPGEGNPEQPPESR